MKTCKKGLHQYEEDKPCCPEARVISSIREAYQAGRNADIMKAVLKEEKK